MSSHEVGDITIALYSIDGTIFATDNVCTQAYALLKRLGNPTSARIKTSVSAIGVILSRIDAFAAQCMLRAMSRFANIRLARMSSGQHCLIRDLGLVKGGKGLRHHEVVLVLSLRGLAGFAIARIRTAGASKQSKVTGEPKIVQQTLS